MKYMIDDEKIVDFKGLKQELYNEIKSDTLENSHDVDIVNGNLILLDKFYGNYGNDESWVIDELKAFGVYVMSLDKLDMFLEDVQEFIRNNKIGDSSDFIDELTDVRKGIKKVANEQ